MDPYEYICNTNPIRIVGGFTLYFDNDATLFYSKSKKKSIRFHKLKENYIGYTKYYLSTYIKRYTANTHGANIVKCPRCESTGDLAKFWRVNCNTCGLWLETDETFLYTWGDILKEVKGYFSNKYYYNNEEISLKEYNELAVYYRLERM